MQTESVDENDMQFLQEIPEISFEKIMEEFFDATATGCGTAVGGKLSPTEIE